MTAEIAEVASVVGADPAELQQKSFVVGKKLDADSKSFVVGKKLDADSTEQQKSFVVALGDDDSSCHSEEGCLNSSDDAANKDSGVDCCVDEPDDATLDAVMRTVEFYLSDANVLKDPFLLKHLRRNREGYVSLKLLASFRKVRSLTRSWEAVSRAVARSQQLALNPEGSKVRRLTPLPDHDETAPSRSVVVSGFVDRPPPTVDGVGEAMSRYGDIALVRMLRPGSAALPSDVKRFFARRPDLQAEVCALVEFEDHASARRASEGDLAGLSVVSVVLPKQQAQDANPPPPKSKTPEDSPKKTKKKNRRGSNSGGLLEVRTRRESSESAGSSSCGDLSSSPGGYPSILDERYKRRNTCHSNFYGSDRSSPFSSLGKRYRERVMSVDSAAVNPWRVRRAQAESGRASSPQLQQVAVGVLRLPRGPDGTGGFSTRPSKLPSTAE